MNKLNSFTKQFVALLKGDDAEVKSQKVWRQADSALKVQIAGLNGDLIRKEDQVEAAKEKLAKARLNHGNEITDREAYVTGLINAKNSLTIAEKELKAHQEQIAFLQGEYDSLGKEEE